jgi:hypothetical protein
MTGPLSSLGISRSNKGRIGRYGAQCRRHTVPIALFYLENSIEPKVHEQNVHNRRFNESKIRQPINLRDRIPKWSKNPHVNRRFTRDRLLANPPGR